jgi:predicted RNA-binding protein YlqC (UPF0109 family)
LQQKIRLQEARSPGDEIRFRWFMRSAGQWGRICGQGGRDLEAVRHLAKTLFKLKEKKGEVDMDPETGIGVVSALIERCNWYTKALESSQMDL